MMVVKDEWMRAAMTDDMLVVELLVRLKQSQTAASSSSSPLLESIPLRWGIRLPRSKSASRFDGVVSRQRNISKHGADSATRCSPTTPLSWSGGTGSPSATADGFEESSCPRSKGTATYESTSTTTATKRARRKKTFAELKEEESSLLKERTYLEKEIATLQATFKQQRAKNENFKRIKLDLNMHPARYLSANFDGAGKAISSQPHERTASSTPSNLPPHPEAQSDSYSEREAVSARDNSFLLPDLNMEPCGEESGSETLYGMS
ncbi:unnamed protein product [Prunus armeniaca]|uniref:BZIP domain-containing protein n=1 Tax=Prunus armeniaca TaxID=36596 RepID=A0A6J5W1E1_PRUAR|nr:hypothetical protein GBA52_000985 [Prunus armeniaca]CAB4293647.1 unnamed protein product [Prunus armeniaca]